MDILITRPASAGTFNALQLDRDLKTSCPKVRAVTVAHHCAPYAVFVHVEEALTPEERRTVEAVVLAHNGGAPNP